MTEPTKPTEPQDYDNSHEAETVPTELTAESPPASASPAPAPPVIVAPVAASARSRIPRWLVGIVVVLWFCGFCGFGHVVRVILEPTRIVWTSYLPPQSFALPLRGTSSKSRAHRCSEFRRGCGEP